MMKLKKETEVVRYNNKWWVLEKESDGMATLWRNGSPTLIPVHLIERMDMKKLKD